MEAQGGDDGEIASERVRFKVHTAGFVTAEIVFFIVVLLQQDLARRAAWVGF